MHSVSTARLAQLLETMRGKKIAVVGDLMLDRYLWGSVVRISPEAPVPVVEVESESESLGGAANVSNNIQSLGAQAIPVGVIGKDRNGQALLELARKSDFPTEGIITDPGRSTTLKARVIAHSQHVVRVDRETKQNISADAEKRILTFMAGIFPQLDAVVLEDYNKGLLTPELISGIIALARKHDVSLTVDPKFDNFFAYQHATVFKPNRKETEEAFGMKIQNDPDLQKATHRLKERLHCENVLITLGENGMLLLDADGREYRLPTRAQKVHDVSGAGDTVIGTLTAALAAGGTILEAAILANLAASIVVAEIGAVPVHPQKLQCEIDKYAQEMNL